MSGSFKVPGEGEGKERFEFQLPGRKKVWSLPYMNDITARFRRELTGIAREINRAETEDDRMEAGLKAEDIQAKILDKYCPGLLDEATGAQVDAIVEAWAEASNSPSLGE